MALRQNVQGQPVDGDILRRRHEDDGEKDDSQLHRINGSAVLHARGDGARKEEEQDGKDELRRDDPGFPSPNRRQVEGVHELREASAAQEECACRERTGDHNSLSEYG
jgi:hypothetical protein